MNKDNNNSKVKIEKIEYFYTYPLISSSNIKEIEFTQIQFNILKLIRENKNESNIKAFARVLHCKPANIRYHINQLHDLSLVYKNATMGVWKLTDSGFQVLNGGKKRKVVKKNKVVKKGCLTKKRQPIQSNLTELESKVYHMHVHEKIKQNLIADDLKTSKQNISKIYNRAKNKLSIIGGNKKEVVMRVSSQPLSPLRYRAHNFRWTIKILKKLENFKGVFSNEINNNTIKIWENSIEIYGELDFFGDTKEDAFFNGLKYYHNLINEFESLYGCILNIDGINNKTLTKCELAETGSDLATNCIKEGNKIVFRDAKGNAWATIDNSFNFMEFEVIAAKTLNPDMAVVQKHLNDWRDKPNSLTNSEITEKIDLLEQLNLKVADGIGNLSTIAPVMAEYNENLKLHIKVQKEQLETQLATQKLLEKLSKKL